ncbi:glycerate dehydrogenase [Nibricoccus aquaticus]|uniref:Glycerate dehydrogenase n=1 Tax=Nibricoccus aquaticus TaxID=2576891 RepID=A0A290QGM9_9BACT|nr:hydroxyacid dehydrogenase [Nibricoccus aquaticus]ATC65426.1 glycerate dehydrogenase [Nibricoccus aquaticus]
MNSPKPRGLFVLDDWAYEQIYGQELDAAVRQRLEIVAPPLNGAALLKNLHLLQDVEVIMGGWGMRVMDETFLEAAPKLRAVFLGAGSVKAVVSEPFWRRGIEIVSAYSMNAIPVAEFTVAAIIFSLKHVWKYALGMQREKRYLPKTGTMPGAYRTTVGLISLGAIGRRTADMLKSYDLHVIAYDPQCSAAQAAELGVELVSLDDVFKRSHVVSLHAPWLPETERMITGAHFAAMRTGATFINTARGIIVREQEMIEVLRVRPDLTALLDVTKPEPPPPDSPLFTLPNVVLTPHIAGAMDEECRRLGHFLVEELDCFLAGNNSKWRLRREQMAWMA